jgi:hypothetical protein
MCSRAFETRSLPSLLATTHRGFTFYVAFPKSSIRALGFAHLCRSRPRGSVRSLLPSQFYLLCPLIPASSIVLIRGNHESFNRLVVNESIHNLRDVGDRDASVKKVIGFD